MDQFIEFIYHRVKSAKLDDVEEILAAFTEGEVAKGSYFKKPDTVIQELGFIIKGSARSWILNKNEAEVTVQIAVENNFISDIISVRSRKSSPVAIEFMENSRIVRAPMSKVRVLLEENLTFNILIREYMGDKAAEMSSAHYMFMAQTAKERYKFMLKRYPELFQRFPLQLIASIIGVTPTQLSRIRRVTHMSE